MRVKTAQLKAHPTIGACGLDCGLCPRFYTAGTSRCPGCAGPGFSDKHPSCSFITCCVRKRGLEACGQCPELPCPKFKTAEEYAQAESSSYPPSRLMLWNLEFIHAEGMGAFLGQQRKRIRLLERFIEGYDDGRSRSFLCRAAALLDVGSLAASLTEARKTLRAAARTNDAAAVLKRILTEAARAQGIELARKR